MKRKYIDELGIKYEQTPQGWNTEINDNRLPYWIKQREEWGFDERETWSLDYTFWLWLYERLRAYNDLNHVNNNDCNKFTFDNEVLTLQECIDRMINNLKLYLSNNDQIEYEEKEKLLLDTIEKFSKTIFFIWW